MATSVKKARMYEKFRLPYARELVNDLLAQTDTSLERTYSNVISEERDHFLGAACAGMEAPEPDHPEFDNFMTIQRAVFEMFARDGQLKIEYQTRVTIGKIKGSL